jgi:endoglucanase
VPTGNLVVAIRYTHLHNGIMNRGDFDQMVEVLVACCRSSMEKRSR